MQEPRRRHVLRKQGRSWRKRTGPGWLQRLRFKIWLLWQGRRR